MDIFALIRNYICPAALSILGPESRQKLRAAGFVEELLASATRVPSNIAEIFQ